VTDGFEVPGATATGPLPAVVARVAALSDRLGVPHSQQPSQLEVGTGRVPQTGH
jgi:hypothetical protein